MSQKSLSILIITVTVIIIGAVVVLIGQKIEPDNQATTDNTKIFQDMTSENGGDVDVTAINLDSFDEQSAEMFKKIVSVSDQDELLEGYCVMETGSGSILDRAAVEASKVGYQVGYMAAIMDSCNNSINFNKETLGLGKYMIVFYALYDFDENNTLEQYQRSQTVRERRVKKEPTRYAIIQADIAEKSFIYRGESNLFEESGKSEGYVMHWKDGHYYGQVSISSRDVVLKNQNEDIEDLMMYVDLWMKKMSKIQAF